MQIPEELNAQPSPTLSRRDESTSLPVRIADVGIAIFVWIATLFLLAFVPLFFLLPYASRHGISFGSPDYIKHLAEFSLKDPTAIFLQVFATLPTHILTILLVWAVLTRFGKRSFREAIGWSWGKYFGPASSIGVGIALFLASLGLTAIVGGDKPTQLEAILNSSPAAKYTIVFLATFTAPFAEEFVYRGILYSSIERLAGKIVAALFVLALFTIVHVPQYLPNYGVIAAVGLLSIGLTVVRVMSGRLLPCVIIHLVFNGIQSILILFGVSGQKPPVTPDQVTSMIRPVLQFIAHSFS